MKICKDLSLMWTPLEKMYHTSPKYSLNKKQAGGGGYIFTRISRHKMLVVKVIGVKCYRSMKHNIHYRGNKYKKT